LTAEVISTRHFSHAGEGHDPSPEQRSVTGAGRRGDPRPLRRRRGDGWETPDAARPNRDPFDALICAAARHLDLPLLSRDAAVRRSGLVEVIW